MAESSERSFAKELNIWVQTIAIIAAFFWGAYTFIYKEIMLPKAAPVNVTVDLQLKKIGQPNLQLQQVANKGLTAIEMNISAVNPSYREVSLLPSVWVAYGYKVNKVISKNPDQDFSKQVNKYLKMENNRIQIEKNASLDPLPTIYPLSPIAVGRLFLDNCLKPNEKVTRKIVFYVPTGKYDLIDAVAVLPALGKKEKGLFWWKEKMDLEWKYDEKQGLYSEAYRVNNNGKRKKIVENKSDLYMNDNNDFEMQWSKSLSTLSLWQ